MGRVSIIKIGQGDFSLGFDVLLQIREDKGSPLVELEGRLAANQELESVYLGRFFKQTRHQRNVDDRRL